MNNSNREKKSEKRAQEVEAGGLTKGRKCLQIILKGCSKLFKSGLRVTTMQKPLPWLRYLQSVDRQQ